MLLGAGLKLGELTELRLEDVDLEASEPCLHVRDASGNSGRVVPLEEPVYEAICSECGKTVEVMKCELDTGQDLVITVMPCPGCLDEAHDEGRREGEATHD